MLKREEHKTFQSSIKMIMMWDEYVNVSVDELASDAQQLREKLLAKIEEVENAPTKS